MNNKTNIEKKECDIPFQCKNVSKKHQHELCTLYGGKENEMKKKKSTGIMEREKETDWHENVCGHHHHHYYHHQIVGTLKSSSSSKIIDQELLWFIIIIKIIIIAQNVRPDSMQCECDNNLVRSDNCIQWWWWWWWIWPLEYVKNFTLIIIIIIINGEKNLFERKKNHNYSSHSSSSSSMSCVDHHHDQWMIKKKNQSK